MQLSSDQLTVVHLSSVIVCTGYLPLFQSLSTFQKLFQLELNENCPQQNCTLQNGTKSPELITECDIVQTKIPCQDRLDSRAQHNHDSCWTFTADKIRSNKASCFLSVLKQRFSSQKNQCYNTFGSGSTSPKTKTFSGIYLKNRLCIQMNEKVLHHGHLLEQKTQVSCHFLGTLECL